MHFYSILGGIYTQKNELNPFFLFNNETCLNQITR